MLAHASRVTMALVMAAGLLAEDQPAAQTPTGSQAAAVKPERHTHFRLGGISFGAGYSRWSGPFCCGYWPASFGLWDPFWYSPYYFSPYFYSPYFPISYAAGPGMGEVKLNAAQPSAEVFLDGAYAGTASDLKNMWLAPGAYNLEVREPGRPPFSRRIYVLTGKILRIRVQPEVKP